MIRPVARFIDDYRIWHKITFERGRILRTRDASWETLDRPEHYREPCLVYPVNGTRPEPALAPLAEGSLAEVTRFTFPSLHPITAYPYPETNTVTGRLYRLRRAPDAPWIVVSHGWAHDAVRGIEMVYVEPLLKSGYNVALPAHPFHLERTPRGTYSGELMVSGDVALTVEAFRQAVADLCAVANWLAASGPGGGRRVGLLGYSLGGYMASLVACLRDDLGAVVIAAAGHSVVSPILETRLGVNVREDLSWSGMDRPDRLERAWGVISPGRLPLRMSPSRVLLLAGIWDGIMLRSSVHRLWEGWGRPPSLWEREGHYTLLAVPGRVVRRSLAFLRERMPPAP